MPLSSQPLRLHCCLTPWFPVPSTVLFLLGSLAVSSLHSLFFHLTAGPVLSSYAPPPLSPLIYSLPCLSPGHFLNGSYCSFEEGECSWQSITGHGLSWRRLQSPAKATRQSCPSSGGSYTSHEHCSDQTMTFTLSPKCGYSSVNAALKRTCGQTMNMWVLTVCECLKITKTSDVSDTDLLSCQSSVRHYKRNPTGCKSYSM